MIKNEQNYKYSDITEKIIGEAYKVYNTLSFGFLEKVYENALCKKLGQAGLKVEQQYPINVYFEEEIIGQYFADLLVEDKIIVELKACDVMLPVFEVQLINYLKATGKEVGLLINFGNKLDVKRKVFSANHKVHKQSASENKE